MASSRAPSLDAEIDALFQLPLAEFTPARNALAGRLKKEKRAIEAERVKGLAKPTAPAWAVNQLFWQERKAFEQLLAVAARVRRAQTGITKKADLGGLLDEKKRRMAELMDRAAAILGAAGLAASPDAMRRVSATLESLAVWGDAEGVPRAGRLSEDLDPPGFDALAALMSGNEIDSAKVLLFRAPPKPPAEDQAAARARARAALQAAEDQLREARRRAERADAALERANARAAAVEKEKQEIEAQLASALAAATAAVSEAKQAAQALAEAERAVAKAGEGLK